MDTLFPIHWARNFHLCVKVLKMFFFFFFLVDSGLEHKFWLLYLLAAYWWLHLFFHVQMQKIKTQSLEFEVDAIWILTLTQILFLIVLLC